MRGDKPRQRGQALVEVALVVPLFFMTLFGIMDLARVIWANDVVANAAREGARYASVRAGTANLAGTPAYAPEATKDEIRARALSYVVAGGVGPTVTVCFSSVRIASQQVGCTGDTDEAGAVYERGNLVTVVVTSDVPIITGALTGLGDFRVSGTSTVIINN